MDEKEYWIGFFHNLAKKELNNIKTGLTNKQKASIINQRIKEVRQDACDKIIIEHQHKGSSNEKTLQAVLSATYASYIAMLEFRNEIWPYDYMTFSRRIGELWEPFCKLPFNLPMKPLKIVEPPIFSDVKRDMEQEVKDFIDTLDVTNSVKRQLKEYYVIPWKMVDSGGIKLNLDLHFTQDGKRYNCDFKSGFSSNEKGNTNRLLLVGSVYQSLGSKEINILFVRQHEEENNHYLQALKHSPYWQVYCADECYKTIKTFTGFDIRSWMDKHVDWQGDISDSFRNYLVHNDLFKYLTW